MDQVPQALNSKFLENFLTEQELAQALGCTVRTLRRWHVQRIGPPRTVCGRLIFYRRTSLDNWLKSHEQVYPYARNRNQHALPGSRTK